MSFGPQLLRGAPQGQSGHVDYRLARDAVVRDFRKGRLSRLDVCDAHPELLRAARNLGEPTETKCPICAEFELVLVSYAFGPRMPSSGKCLASRAEIKNFANRASELVCYVVEVCPGCSWNHLFRMQIVGGRQQR